MNYNLEPEQFEFIEKAIKNLLTNRKGIFNFLNKRGQVINLEDKIYIPEYTYSRDLYEGEIGIKSLPFSAYGIKIRNLALIKMIIKIDRGLINRWDNNGRQGMVLHDLKIHGDIKRFLDQIEQFMLRGTDTKNEFAINDICKNEVFNCFFHGHYKHYPISLAEFKDLHEAAVSLDFDLRKEHYNPPFTLMSDSETLKWAKYKNFQTPDGIVSYKDKIEKREEFDKWIDLDDNADNSKRDDNSLVCIANKELSNNTFKIIEKSPLSIFTFYGGIVLSWCGALEVNNNNAIQCIKIEL